MSRVCLRWEDQTACHLTNDRGWSSNAKQNLKKSVSFMRYPIICRIFSLTNLSLNGSWEHWFVVNQDLWDMFEICSLTKFYDCVSEAKTHLPLI